MSVSTRYVREPSNITKVVDLYLSDEKPTLDALARSVGTTFQNVQAIVKASLPPEQLKAEQRLRYSRSKMGAANPMLGRYGSLHHNHIGEVRTKEGYLQRKVNGRYELVHRQTMAEALGLDRLPDLFDVHHIDGIKDNNSLDNLALVTPLAHRQLHATRSQFSKSPLWVQHLYGTCQSP